MDLDRGGGDGVSDDHPHVRDKVSSGSSLRSQVLSRLSDPTIVRPVETLECDIDDRNQAANAFISLSRTDASSLSSYPWKYYPAFKHTGKSNDDSNKRNNSDGAEQPQRKRRRGDYIAPNYSYLDLRTFQNMSWANSQLQSGVEHAKRAHTLQDESSPIEAAMREYTMAEKCYRDGLDLVPSHPELLVALGALCANLRRDEEAIEILIRAVKITRSSTDNESKEGSDIDVHDSEDGDKDCYDKDGNDGKNKKQAEESQSSTGENARRYLAEIKRRMATKDEESRSSSRGSVTCHPFTPSKQPPPQSSIKTKGGEARVEQALKDALAERAFLSGGPIIRPGKDAQQSELSKYELIDEPLSKEEVQYAKIKSDGQEDHKRERKRRHKRRSHAKKRKKKKKKSYRYSSDGSDSRSDYSSSGDNCWRQKKRTVGKSKKRKRDKERRKEHKRRRRNDSSSDDSSISSSSSSLPSAGSRSRHDIDRDRKKENKRRRHNDEKDAKKSSSHRRETESSRK